MAKKKVEDQSEKTEQDENVNTVTLAKMLVRKFNDGEAKQPIAWTLANGDSPTSVSEFISTGSTLLDYAIANRPNGGVPVGKITEIVGEEASGKSLLIAHIIAECQRRGGLAILLDSENAADPQFLKRLGVNINELVYIQPSCCEEVGDVIEKTINLVRAKAQNRLILIAWDSIANSPTRAELEGNFDLNMNLQLEKSKVLSKMMRKLVDMWAKERICVVFTNQLKVKVGVMYGDPMTTPGGKAVPYAASVRVRLTKSEQLKTGKGEELQEGTVYGINTIAKVIKNRLGPPFRQCRFDITFAHGIDDKKSWFSVLHERGEIEKSDGWCYYSSYPSGKTIKRKDKETGKEVEFDRGIQFREKKWVEMLEEPNFRKKVLFDLEKHMVVSYDEQPHDAHVDEDSLLDSESVLESGMLNE